MVTILSVAGRLPPWSPGDANLRRLAAAPGSGGIPRFAAG